MVAFLDSLADTADVNKRIERAVIDHRRRTYSLDTVQVWDLWLPELSVALPHSRSWRQYNWFRRQPSHWGRATRELAQLLDPANGRLDVAGPTLGKP